MRILKSFRTALQRLRGWLRMANRRRVARRRNRHRQHVGIQPGALNEAGAQPGALSVSIQRISAARSARAQASNVDFTLGASTRLTVHDLCAELGSGQVGREIVVSISHDDYAVSVGGIQNVISDECAEFTRRGIAYLHLCPVHPILDLAPEGHPSEFHFAVRLGGRALGRIDGLALREALGMQVQQGISLHWTLHHLMGHSPEVVEQLIDVGAKEPPLFWVHDFFAVCTSYSLMRNDVLFCNAPPQSSPACRVCVYGQERDAHSERTRRLLRNLMPTIVAPSQSALDLWSRAMKWSGSLGLVQPPARLLLKQTPRPPRTGPLRIAFLGRQAYHKGWEVFRQLAETFRSDSRFEFFQFSEFPHGLPRGIIHHVPVKVDGTHRDAMVRAVALREIDVVVCWSLWPETFNFTAHEAIAAGAFLVVRRDQGNVWPAARTFAPQASRALEDEFELAQYLSSGRLIEDVAASPRYFGTVLPSMGSAELLAVAPQSQGVPCA